jgi:tetratricopeptide (TPR) repeat protein
MILAASLVALLAAARPQPEPDDAAAVYHEVVAAFRGGQVDSSLERLLDLDQDAVWRLVHRLAEQGGTGVGLVLDAEFFGAAAILHTDAAVRGWDDDHESEGWAHLALARLLADAAEPEDAGPGSFRRRWYAAASLLVAGHAAPLRGLEYFESAVEAVPRDAPLLTAAGWFAERLSEGAAPSGSSHREVQVVRRRHQRSAERYLARALDVDPRAEEAALRLARVETLMGRDVRAGGRLTALLARDTLAPFTAYLARLFLGGIRARAGDARDAGRLYREAIALDPVAQSARVALAQLLYSAGDSTAAAEVVEPLASRAADRGGNDPWSDYQLAYPAVGGLLLDDLRDEVQR